jgi:hypothetical protein
MYIFSHKMKYLLLLGLLAASPKVSDNIFGWVTNIPAIQVRSDLIYNRTVDLQGPNFILKYEYRGQKHKLNISGNYTVRYVDKGKLGRSVEDEISFENNEVMFWDQGLDGILEGGHIKGIFFSKDLPKGLLNPMQEVYSKVINKSTRKIHKDKNMKIYNDSDQGTITAPGYIMEE